MSNENISLNKARELNIDDLRTTEIKFSEDTKVEELKNKEADELLLLNEENYLESYNNNFNENNTVRTIGNVGTQDSTTVEDLNDISDITEKGVFTNSVISSLLNAVDDNYFSILNINELFDKKKNITDIEDSSKRVKSSNDILYKIRDNINVKKTIKTNIFNDRPYNNLNNVCGLAAVTMVGALGKSKDPSFNEFLNEKGLEKILYATDSIMGVTRMSYEVENSILDRDEIIELNSVTFNNFFNNKPGIKTGIEANERNKEIVNRINNIKNEYKKRSDFLGEIFVEPFYNESNFVAFKIPFQFNPVITEGAIEAKYDEVELLGRINNVKTWINTSSAPLQLELTYMILAKDKDNKLHTDSENVINETDSWMFKWTPKEIEKIELQLRSLVFPNLNDGNFVRPPIVTIQLSSTTDKVSSLYSYPELYYPDLNNNNPDPSLSQTRLIDGIRNEGYGTDGSKPNIRYKKYVVTSVQINPIGEDFSSSFEYRDGMIKRKGFKASLSLSETTKNFLDLVPDFKTYYNAWNKLESNNKTDTNNQDGDNTETEANVTAYEAEFNEKIDDFININKNFAEEIFVNNDNYKEFIKYYCEVNIFEKVRIPELELDKRYSSKKDGDMEKLKNSLEKILNNTNEIDIAVFEEMKKFINSIDKKYTSDSTFNANDIIDCITDLRKSGCYNYYFFHDNITECKIDNVSLLNYDFDGEMLQLARIIKNEQNKYLEQIGNRNKIEKKIKNYAIEIGEILKEISKYKVDKEVIYKQNYESRFNKEEVCENLEHYILHRLEEKKDNKIYNYIVHAFGFQGVNRILGLTTSIIERKIKNYKNFFILSKAYKSNNKKVFKLF